MKNVEPAREKHVAREGRLDPLVRLIVDRFSPEKVILFGSRARGDADSESDLDLLVLFPELEDPRRRAAQIYQLLSGAAISKDIVVSTTARYERYKNVPNTIYWPAAREGRVLYERST